MEEGNWSMIQTAKSCQQNWTAAGPTTAAAATYARHRRTTPPLAAATMGSRCCQTRRRASRVNINALIFLSANH